MSDYTVNSDTDAFLVASMTSPQQAAIRTRIGLGTAATTAATDYATAAQGTTADGAAQKSANLSDLASAATARTNLGLGTAATSASTDFAAASHTHIGTAIDYAGTTDIGAALADADEFLVSDGGGNTTRVKSAISRVWTYIKSKIDAGNTFAGNQTFSGDITFSGSMTAKGSSGEVQYNNGGILAGAADVEIEGGQLRLPAIADPTPPAAGGIKLYSQSMAGHILPKVIDYLDNPTALQAGLHGNFVAIISPTGGNTAPSAVGCSVTTSGTISNPYTPGSTARWDSTQRKRFQTTTTAGNAASCRTNYTIAFRGNAAGFGGFFFRAQFGMQINLNGGQKFIGLCASTGALGGDPSALTNMIGVGYDAADSSAGNWFLMRNDGSGTATRVDLGANAARNTTDGYDLIIHNPQNSSDFYVYIYNLSTSTLVLDTSYNTDVPAVNTGMAIKCDVRNGAVAAADNIEFAKIYLESDY